MNIALIEIPSVPVRFQNRNDYRPTGIFKVHAESLVGKTERSAGSTLTTHRTIMATTQIISSRDMDGISISSNDDASLIDSSSDQSTTDVQSRTETSTDNNADLKEVRGLIKNESKRVRLWREVVTGALIIVATLVTVTTYVLFSRLEVDDFEVG